MSEELKKVKKKKVNLSKVIAWAAGAIIIVQLIFAAGLYVGTQATLNSQAEDAKIKTQAIEDYKATVKDQK